MEAYFEGDLVRNEELSKVARQRRKKYHEIAVPKTDTDSYLTQGWKIKTEHKTSVKLRKDKAIDELLEDRVWLLFKSMDFLEMNRDRNFKIQAGPVKKQIDVFARDQNRAFVVECKASAEATPVSREEISDICNLSDGIRDSIRAEHNNRSIAVSFLMATQGIHWPESNELLAKEGRVIIWKEAELEYFEKLVKHLGSAAKFQIYSVLFPKDEIPEPLKVPAICGGKGNAKYYCFVIQPEKLLQVAYVHHRRSTPEELQGSYQRMVDKSRLKKINTFITQGGYFANNIILNFTAKPTFRRFEKEMQVGDVICGILEFPRQYASAWIIDGQHRLYGYADNPRKSDATVPVLAFQFLNVRDQARLFVEINKEQKAVSPNLLWDLFPDIYHDAKEDELQRLRAISLVVRKLNSDSDSPLRDHISIPSVTSKGRGITSLTMATVCEALKESKLLDAKEGLLYNEDYDSTVDFAVQRIKAYFDVISESFPQDWGKGNRGLLRTNIGIRILIAVFRQVILYFRNLGQEQIFRKKNLSEFRLRTDEVLNPMLTKLKSMPEEERSAIRRQTAKGLVLDNTRRMVWQIKEQFDELFGRESLSNWAPSIPAEVTDADIKALLQDTETALRTFIALKLKELYGEPWWRQGIPAGVKKAVDEKIQETTKKATLRAEELKCLTADRKMNYTDTPHLRETIEYSLNWKHFQQFFVTDKEYTLTQFKSFENVRHKYQHFAEQELDEISKNLGYWGMRWIGKCIGLGKDTEVKK